MEVVGFVDSFDGVRGLGTISSEGATYAFHCVDIADGTRSIAVGAKIRAERSVGRLGHDEVVRVVKL